MTRRAIKSARTVARGERLNFVRRPPASRRALLSSTALVAGVLATGLVGSPQAANAACSGTDPVTCSGSGSAKLSLSPTANFSYVFDPTFQLDVTDDHGVALNANGHSTTATGIEFQDGSSVTVSGGGKRALKISEPQDVTITVDTGAKLWSKDDSAIFSSPASAETPANSSLTIFNYGTIQGGTTEGGVDGLHLLGHDSSGDSWLSVAVDNQSLIAGYDNGIDVTNHIKRVQVDNGDGLIAGYTGSGISINAVTNMTEAPAVDINNGGGNGGIISGGDYGIHITSITAEDGNADVVINNGMYYDTDSHTLNQGGLIVGGAAYASDPYYTTKGEDGIFATSVSGGVTIYNDGTLNNPFDAATVGSLDPVVGEQVAEWGSLGFGGLITGEDGVNRGIWGAQSGIDLTSITGLVDINNGTTLLDDGTTWSGGGMIVGAGNDGIHLSGIGSGAKIYNVSGLVWGAEDGVDIFSSTGDVSIDNSNVIGYDNVNHVATTIDTGGYFGTGGGTIFGVGQAIHVVDLTGDVLVGNAGGAIASWNDDAIHVYNAGDTVVENGWWNGSQFADGGWILGNNSAISIQDVPTAEVYNGTGGAVIGWGTWDGPVVRLTTSSEDAYVEGGHPHQSAFIVNDGLMASYDIFAPGDVGSYSPAPGVVPEAGFDVTPYLALADSTNPIAEFVWSGGQNGSLGNDLGAYDPANLANYATAAGDVLVRSDGGALDLVNNADGVMIGRVVADGHNGSDWPDVTGNEIDNYGVWFTTNSEEWGNGLHGSANDTIRNMGWIQTALDGSGTSYTSFDGVNDFYNAPTEVGGSGLISMIDGGAGDVTWIDHNFHGGNPLGIDDGPTTYSYLGVDVHLGSNGEDGYSDQLQISEDASGSTGLIIHKTNTTPGGLLPDPANGIVVASSYTESGSSCYYNQLCKVGDTFYISDRSQDYLNVNGVGAVQDGLYAWYLTERGGIDPQWVLISDFAPQAVQTAGIVTGAQNEFYDTSNVVGDHIYNTYLFSGGGGADLPYADAAAGGATGQGSSHGLWAKVTGNWASRTSTYGQDIGGSTVNVDTGSHQDNYSILGGADFRPNPGSQAFNFGIFGGYVNSTLKFDSYGTSATYEGGKVGAYAAVLGENGLYADVAGIADIMQTNYKVPSISVNSSATTSDLGVMANIGKRMVGAKGYIEPLASFAYLNTSIGDMSSGGVSIQYSNGNSVRGGVGVRIGTEIANPGKGTVMELSLLGRVWDEFGSANQVTVTDTGSGNSATYTDGISGVFGEIAGTATLTSTDRSYSGFVTGSAKFGSDYLDVGAQIGVRKAF